MRSLVSSDWHPDWTTYGVSRFDEVERAIKLTVQQAIDNCVGHYFFLGDLCDPDTGPVVFRCVKLALQVATTLAVHQIHSHWLVGNHDVIEDGSGSSTLSPIGALQDFTSFVHLYEKPGVNTSIGRSRLLALPFTPTSHTYDPQKYVDEFLRVDGPGIVLSHLKCENIIPGEETEAMPRGRDIVLPLIALAKRPNTVILQGHYHKQQSHGPLHIPGSVARLTFSEVNHEPSFLLMDL
jgi:DNA repair exonuclease SbcCD nuclease subunit